MSASIGIPIRVLKIINAPGRGVFILARIEGATVHLGDCLKVQNRQSEVTARVGQITVGAKLVKEAVSGDEPFLFLEDLSDQDIHIGDGLLPVEKKDLLKSDKDVWEKLPERIYPIRHLGEFTGIIAFLIFLGIFWIVPVFVLWSDPMTIPGNNKLIGAFIAWYTALGFGTFWVVKRFVIAIKARDSFQRSQAQTEARIIRRRFEKHSDRDGITYRYYLQLAFNPLTMEFNATNLHRLEVLIDEKLYKSLLDKESVNLTYAIEDPRIFILEGE